MHQSTPTLDTSRPSESLIDLIDPVAACQRLNLDTLQLLDVINRGELAAYDLGGVIRFRSSDVSALELRLAIAA